MKLTRRVRGRSQGFGLSEDGSSTVETVLWLPVIFGFLVMIADVSMIFNGQARMLRIVQDANRSLSIGRLGSEDEAMQQIRTKVAHLTDDPYVSTTIDQGIIRTTLSVPASSLDVVGWYAQLAGATVTVTSEHFVEY